MLNKPVIRGFLDKNIVKIISIKGEFQKKE